MNRSFHRYAKPLVGVAVVLACWYWARLPALDEAEAARLAERFQFKGTVLAFAGHVAGSRSPARAGVPNRRNVRDVHPDLHGIASWASGVGAAVALNDLDGDGLANDVCLVDARTDEVILAPVPGTGDRYQPFSLSPRGLPYEPSTMAPMGCMPGDFNEDGWSDLLVTFWGRSPRPVSAGRRGDHPGPGRVPRGGGRPAGGDLEHQLRHPGRHGRRRPHRSGARKLLPGRGPHAGPAGHLRSGQLAESMAAPSTGAAIGSFCGRGGGGGSAPTPGSRKPGGSGATRWNAAWTLAVGAADLDGDVLPELYFANDFGPRSPVANRSTPGEVVLSCWRASAPSPPRSRRSWGGIRSRGWAWISGT